MTIHEAQAAAAKLGLSAWVSKALVVGEREQVTDVMCVGFERIGLAVAEGESWAAVLDETARIVFSA